MSKVPWAELEALFHETLEQPADSRARFLAERCGSRTDLLAEIESLLRAHESTRARIPLDPQPARMGNSLRPGMSIGPYEILDEVGSGGMGAVYRARDTRLNRTVALKALRTDLGSRSDLRDRFKREAELIASLNHPSICTLYDVISEGGSDYLVMEFIDGETLAARLAHGPLSVEQATRLAHEIAAALGRAHAHGIVHRDLKPANIIITRSGGRAKLLDFGVAKLWSPAAAGFGHQTAGLTAEGVIVGTPRYLAPEQIEGAAVDGRTDVFAFGAVLLEMLTGRPAFDGRSTASIIAAVLAHHPAPASSTRTGVSPALDRVVQKCLAKNPDERWQSADDLASELKWIGESHAADAGETKQVARHRGLVWALGAAAVLSIAALVAVVARPRTPQQTYRLSLTPPDGATLVPGQPLIVSPDGATVAMVATDAAGKTRLHLKTLATGEVRAIEGTDQPTWPFWSPDGTSLGFFAEGKLKTLDLMTGAIRAIADAPLGRGGSWNRNDQILFAAFNQDRLYRVPASGGSPTAVTTINPGREFAHMWPVFLPDGVHFLYHVTSGDPKVGGVYLGSLNAAPPRRLFAAGGDTGSATFAPPDHILFTRGGSVFAQRFDVNRLTLDGEPSFVTSATPVFLGRSLVSASATGTVVASHGSMQFRLALLDRAGRELRNLGDYQSPHSPQLSPDGTRALLSLQGDEWIIDIARGVMTRLTSTSGDDGFGFWSGDGRSVLFASNRTGVYSVWRKPTDAPGAEELLAASPRGLFPTGLSEDQQWLMITGAGESGSFDISALHLPDRRVVAVAHGPFEERAARITADGRAFAYMSNEAGGLLDVFVSSFPVLDRKIRISTGGGFGQAWNGAGDELFYIDHDGRMMSVPIRRAGGELSAGTAKALFQTRLDVANLPFFPRFSVSRDGQRFLMVTPSPDTSNAATVILNWRQN